MKLSPKSLTGILHNNNKGACDWGWQGMLAYGCQTLVVIVDPKTMQVIQTLDRHKGYIVKVKWSRENYHHDLANPYSLRLTSTDYNGHIIVWDVAQAAIKSEFSDGSKPVADLEWLSSQDASHDLLAALHPPHSLILWNADTGTKLWKKSYTESLQAFAFDPFETNKLAFLGQDCIVFVDDFSINKVPSSNGKKYYISSPSSQASNTSSGNADKVPERKTSKSNITRRVSNILVGESSKKNQEEEAVAINECLQLTYHQACRNHLILLYAKEILVLDLDINQTVGIIPMERTGSPFVQVLPLRQRDIIMCLHENGAVTVRVRRRLSHSVSPPGEQAACTPGVEESPVHQTYLDVSYDLRCQSDPLRVTKNNRVMGVVVCPVSEKQVSLIMSDGKVLLWELTTVDYTSDGVQYGPQAQLSPLYTPGTPLQPWSPIASGHDPNAPRVSHPKSAVCDLIGRTQSFVLESQANQNKHGVLLKFVLIGLLNGMAAPHVVIRMCPPLTTKNWNIYQPLLATGTSTGMIQVVNLSSGQLLKELAVHSCAVRGMEWVSLHSFLSFAYASPASGSGSSPVRNELFLTDIQTGKSIAYRPNRDEESPIELVKISYLKQYFVIVFKEKPFELWDLRTGTLLRQMPRNFPQVTALEWSPSHNLKSLKKKLANENASSSQSHVDLMSASSTNMDSSNKSDTKHILQNVSAREHFVFTDADGLMYHFIVEGNMIKDGSRIPPDGGMGSITSIAWKSDTMVLGDVDGNLNIWDLKARVSRAVPTHRGWIRRLKFAPGRGNMKLLVVYNDGADIWDAKDVELYSSVKTPKEIPKVQDADWAASDKPVLSCADGTIRVMDIKFKTGSASMDDLQLSEPVLSPHLLPSKAALTLKQLLQHQAWRPQYHLYLEETEDNGDICDMVNEQLALLNSDLKDFLPVAPFGTAQRCLLTARLFGDESEVNFWTVALHYLRSEKAEPMSKSASPALSQSGSSGDLFIPSTPVARETHDLVVFDECQKDKPVSTSHMAHFKDKPLETCYDILTDSVTFQKSQLERVMLHDSKRLTNEHTRKCAEMLMMLGQADRAVQLLLETDPNNEQHYVDCLRACLVASIRSSGASQSTIKLVATNLIASSKLWEGVQLLCLIDKGLDACRYLQTYGQWYQAAWLAKATLSYTECSEVLKRWADHLDSPNVNQKSRAVLVMMSLGQFVRVVEMLYSMRHFDRAALFVESCIEFDLLDKSEETNSLVEAVFLEYARLLVAMGARKAAEVYCAKAGDKGQMLLNDINSLAAK